MSQIANCSHCGKPEEDHALHGNWCPANHEDAPWSKTLTFLPLIPKGPSPKDKKWLEAYWNSLRVGR